MKKMKKYIYPALIVLFSAILIGSSVYLIDYFIKSKKQQDNYNELSNLVEQVQQQQNSGGSSSGDGSDDTLELPGTSAQSAYVEVVHPETGETLQILREYAPIFELNPDTIGWLKIPGTLINYPVLQTPDSPNYYLTRDFYKEKSKHGAIYASELADIARPSDNITLYGHKMADGSMFASLHRYKDENFYKENPYIIFDTLTTYRRYQIVAVFRTTSVVGEGFAYHDFVDGNVFTFAEFVNQCKALSFYDTGVEVNYGDKLLTLSTCDHSISNGRFVVVAKQIY